jgi:lipase
MQTLMNGGSIMPAINVNGATLSYRKSGSGPIVVALHSTASSGRQWKNLTAHLEQKYTVITPDLSGYGGSSSWPGYASASLGGEANFVFSLIEKFGERVHLVGHSFGGAVALKIAMMRPGWLRSLTLIEPALFHVLREGSAGDEKLYREISAIAGVVNAAVCEGVPERGMARFVDFWNGAGAWSNTTPHLRVRLAGQIAQAINNFAAGFAECWHLKMARAITCPTLAIMGLESPFCSQRVTEMLAETIPAARLAMVPGAGHMVPLTDPHIIDPMISGHVMSADLGWVKPAPKASIIPLHRAA